MTVVHVCGQWHGNAVLQQVDAMYASAALHAAELICLF